MIRSRFEECRLGELLAVEPQSGVRRNDEGEADVLPYVTTGTVSQGSPILSDVPSERTFGDVRGRVVLEGDLLLVSRGVERFESVPCAIVRFHDPAAFSEALIRLRVDPRLVDPDYLRLYLTSRRGRAALATAVTGSVISNLSREALQEVEIYLPNLEAQERVVVTMTNIEAQSADLQATLNVLQDLYDTAREGFAAGLLAPTTLPNQLQDKREQGVDE